MNGQPEHANPGSEQPHIPVDGEAEDQELESSVEGGRSDSRLPRTSGSASTVGTVWAAVGISLGVLVVLIVFILQNQDYVQVRFFGLVGSVPAGVALVIGAVGGGILVGAAGAARILQLRFAARRLR